MAERVACTGFWAAFRTATSGFETGLVAALASGRLAWLIVNFFMSKIMGACAAGRKRGDAPRDTANFSPPDQVRGKPCSSRQRRIARPKITPTWSAPSTSFLAGCDNGETKSWAPPTVRPGCRQMVRLCQPGWPVDRTSLEVGIRNPPRRLRTDPSMRSVTGISGLQAGEDAKQEKPDRFSPCRLSPGRAVA